MGKDRLRMLDWKLTDKEPDIVKKLCSIDDTSLAIRENYISIYYHGEVLYNIITSKRPKGFRLLFDAGHFRYWNGEHGAMSKPKNWNEAEKGSWEDSKYQEWDKAWKAIDEDLTPKLEECMRVLPYIKLNKSIEAYAKKAKQNFKDKKDAPSWDLTINIKNLDQAKAIVDDKTADGIVMLQEKAIKEFVSEKGRREREYAEKLMHNNRILDLSNPKPGRLLLTDCEYNLPKEQNELLDQEAEAWPDELYDAEKNLYGIGKPDGVGLLYCGKDEKWHPCLVEVKYGTKAYGGNSGIRRHMRDMVILASDKTKIKDRLDEIEHAYQKLCDFTQESAEDHDYPAAQEISDAPVLLFVLQCDDEKKARKELLSQIKLIDERVGLTEKVKEGGVFSTLFVFTKSPKADDFASCFEKAVKLETLLAELH